MKRPDYGLDAPGLVRGFFAVGAGCALAAGLLGALAAGWWTAPLAALLGAGAAYALFMGCMMLVESRIVKPRDRERILDLIPWRGDEAVLDAGCGRGLMLVGAARRLRTGRAIGVDIWSGRDQSANSAEAALENARIEGVADRVEVRTADMRALPFPDASFDVVTSAWALHNVEPEQDRRRALAELLRVLRPTGALLLTDIEGCQTYRAEAEGISGRSAEVVVFSPALHRFRSTVSFGAFAPATVLIRPAWERATPAPEAA